MAGEGYLPPVVISFQGDATDFFSTLAEVKTALAQFAGTTTNTQLGADPAKGLIVVESFKTQIAASTATLPISANDAKALADVAALEAAIDAQTATIKVDANVGPALAAIVALKAAMAAIGAATAGSTLGATATELGAGTGFAGIFAGFGSVLSLMGFGFEHVLTTALGLVGSLAGALTGGLVLAFGAAGVAAVGFGTDLAGIGQAAGDISSVYKVLSQYQTAAQGLNKVLPQSAAAQAALNTALAGFSPAAGSAVEAAALTASQFHWMFDQVTGQAEATGAEIINQFLEVGEKFLPIIGKFATQNMAIIQSALQPLFTWLSGPGLKIFTELEQVFQNNLPAAMGAFDNGIELIIKTLGFLAPYTGRFITFLDNLFTRLNSPAGFAKFTGDLAKLINLFRVWETFFKVLIEDIALLFSKSAGLGSGIIQELTTYLNQLHKALSAPGGGNLSKLFAVHKAEVLELIKVIVDLGKAFVNMYLIASPFLTQIATLVLQLIAGFIELANKIPGGAEALGLTLLLAKMGILGAMFGSLGTDAGLFQRAIYYLFAPIRYLASMFVDLVAVLGQAIAGMVGLTTESAILNVALGAIAVVALAAGIILLVKYWHQLGAAAVPLAAVLGVVAAAFVASSLGVDVFAASLWATGIPEIILGLTALGVAIYELATHWSQAVSFMRSGFGTLILAVLALVAPFIAVPALIALHWNAVVSFFEGLPSDFKKIGKDIISGLVAGIEAEAKTVVGVAKKVGSDILGGFKSVLGIFSPSTVTKGYGTNLNQGLALGITSSSGQAINAAKQVANQIVKAFGSLTGAGPLAAALKSIQSVFSNLSKVFTDFTNLSKKSATITQQSMSAIILALTTIQTAAPAIVGGIDNVVLAFKALDKSKTVGVTLGNLGTVLGTLGKIFGDLGTASKNSSTITVGALSNIQGALFLLILAAPTMVKEIQDLEKEFKKLGDMSALNKELDSLNTLFKNLAGVFTNLSKASSDAANVTPGSLQTITNAITALANALKSLPGTIATTSTATTSAFSLLVSSITGPNGVLTKALPQFQSIGLSMMQGLQAGIVKGTAAVVAAAVSAATQAAAAVKAATKTSSPSQLYAEEGMNWMLGLVQGIKGGAGQVQSTLTSSLPHVGSGTGAYGTGGLGGNLTPTYNITINAATGNGTDISTALKKVLDQHDKQLIQSLRSGTA